MLDRRKFISNTLLGSIAAGIGCKVPQKGIQKTEAAHSPSPLVISTWDFGKEANEAAWNVISSGGRAVDAVEQGVRIPEADPNNSSVGYGGLPDRDGRVTLDACIMDETGKAGSVSCIEHIMHPISVARLVMDKTPHVMLVGDGALQFALEQGFEKIDLLTDSSRKAWEEWKIKSDYHPVINIENHDTIGMIAIDQKGNLSGACTTSGLAFKMHGRVGDSPIIGAGLYVDNEVGGAASTGLGEAVLRTLGSFLIVELMRNGMHPVEACKETVMRVVHKNPNFRDFQVGFVAVNKSGEHGAYAIQPGFTYALFQNGKNIVLKAGSYL